MPPRPRTRAYAPDATRAAVRAQLGHVRAAVAALDPADLAAPTRLGGWTVRELVAHLGMVARSVVSGLEQPAPPRQEASLADYVTGTAPLAAAIDEGTHALAAEGDPRELLERIAARFAELLANAPGDRLVPSRVGAFRLDEYLVTRCVELVVHTDDLAAALGAEIPFDRQALATTTRLLADALAAAAPGGAVEVRVPPFAVVQCVEGPRHTRGTPPNVVETDPLTWIRLATGRTSWADAAASGAVTASGERADLAAYLPVMS
ncbi:sterol carrier family protein [Streptomyces sp. B1866]|uniref:sterol carrier family protein n=1 Tax=Streptomyces sp. B1866 TaxID=3075431 RepID=UPI00288C7174|nr:sterol carrier family protein [Streptomyces sp. B1866]MDT3396131.1 sterol carrier family protein [Streptomyces sp. B1866]